MNPRTASLIAGLAGAAALCAMVAATLTSQQAGVRILTALSTLFVATLWMLLQRKQSQFKTLSREFGDLREEAIARRSTMRFIFDELLAESPLVTPCPAQASQKRPEPKSSNTTIEFTRNR